MTSSLRILILLHETDALSDRSPHLIWFIAREWIRMGFRVEAMKGLRFPPPGADLLIPHIDLTRVPESYCDYINAYSNIINRRVVDISKRVISANILDEMNSFDGPVIVKTDNNFGGQPERRLESAPGSNPAGKSPPVRKWSQVTHFNPEAYPVFQNMNAIPPGVWRNQRLVVEKFIPEREGHYYCARVCFFLGDVILNRRVFSHSPIVKGRTIVDSEILDAPPEIQAIRERLGFDYGKFDYVMHDGNVHLLDANKTPGCVADRETNETVAGRLAGAVRKYLDAPQTDLSTARS